ncbi:uncharacterized protein TNCV_3188431 [Trichonephila clavipes]|nr:uncharacterized protein TNCV_3188431 [Trichonephila clavipes]
MENTYRRPSGKRPKKGRFRGNQFMKVCPHTNVAERRDTVMSLPNPVEQKSYDVINNKLSRVMKEVVEESMKRAVVEENSSSPDNLLTVSGDGTWKTRGHSSLIGVCTVIWAETGDGDTKTFNAPSENKPYGDDHLIQKIECVGHVEKRMGTRLRKLKLVYSKNKLSDGKTIGGKGRLTDSLIDKLAHYYGNAIRCNSTSVKEIRKAIWAVWGHSCSTDDEPMHWFCPTNPNTWWVFSLHKIKGKKIHPDKTRSYVQCKHCPDLQLTPNHILECPTVATKLLKMGMVPLRDSLRELLYSPDAPRIAEAVIKTFDGI